MSDSRFFRLDRVSVVDVSGADAMAILHNLTTNEVKSLAVGEGCETFVTDVRGKTLGHVHLYRENDFVRLIGPAEQSERVAAHVDRYIIREDATPAVRDEQFVAFAVTDAKVIGAEFDGGQRLTKTSCAIGDQEVSVYHTRWLGPASALILVEASEADSLLDRLAGESVIDDEQEFHRARTNAGFPWMGIDLDETNLPQEADRDRDTISFTKGCYLGQETVARLDALGQVQKKLVRWAISGGIPEPGTKLTADGKDVARLTSVADGGEGGVMAIGFARRSHFDPGSVATAVADSGATEITGTVL